MSGEQAQAIIFQRVIAEKEELDAKAKRLSEFIGNNPVFDDLDPEEQERLKVQNDLMWQYSEVLEQRITAYFSSLNPQS